MHAGAAQLWAGVDALIDREPAPDDLVWHRLHLLAARRWRRQGREVPEAFAHAEHLAAIGAMAAPRVLELVRERVDGPLVLIKGLEVAQRYPDPALRPLRDLDLLVADAGAAHARLLAAGFEVIDDDEGDDDDLHHGAGLVWPGLPVIVKVHRGVKWPARAAAPSAGELLACAVPSSAGVDGILTLPPPEHAVLLAAHAWAHQPLRRVSDLLDVALMTPDVAARARADLVAQRWDVDALWRTTRDAADTVLSGAPASWALRTWARDLPQLRRRTTFEAQVERWAAPLFELPAGGPRRRAAASAFVGDLRPRPGQSWRDKLARTAATARDSRVPKHEHDARA